MGVINYASKMKINLIKEKEKFLAKKWKRIVFTIFLVTLAFVAFVILFISPITKYFS